MEAILFAFFVFSHPNDYDDDLPYAVPLEYSYQVYWEAERYENVTPEEAITVLIAEHGGRDPYPADSVGKDGEIGLFQVVDRERREANEALGMKVTSEDLFDWRHNMRVAVYTMHQIQHKHATADRCQRKIKAGVKLGPGGKIRPRKKEQEHSWHAHYRCGVDTREACHTSYRERLEVRFTAWEAWAPVQIWRAVPLPSWQHSALSWLRSDTTPLPGAEPEG